MKDFFKRMGKPDTRTVLSIIALLGLFSFIGLLFVVPVPHENVALLNTLMPMLVSSVLVVSFSYYFGSSKTEKSTTTTKIED